MAYKASDPTYEAVQWNGENVEECETFFLAWFPQPPPPRPDMPPPPPPFQHDPETNMLNVIGYLVNLGDWLVNGGTWVEGGMWAGSPEVMPNDVFVVKFSATP